MSMVVLSHRGIGRGEITEKLTQQLQYLRCKILNFKKYSLNFLIALTKYRTCILKYRAKAKRLTL